jgi:DNA-binding MarR family transcriptional regulator
MCVPENTARIAPVGSLSAMSEDAAPRWLNDEEMAAWLPLVTVLATLPSALEAQLQREAKLTMYEHGLLAALDNAGEPLRMTDLSIVTSGQMSRLSQVVTKLEQRGWVRRISDPDDGRVARVALRAAGRRQLTAAAPGHVRAVRRYVFDQLSPSQVKQLSTIMAKIAKAVGTPVPPMRP